jgi:hypothetical protein
MVVLSHIYWFCIAANKIEAITAHFWYVPEIQEKPYPSKTITKAGTSGAPSSSRNA